MIDVRPTMLEGYGVRLEPLTEEHGAALSAAASDGRLWELWFTFVPAPDEMSTYIADALTGQREGHMLPWAVRELASGTIVGTTRYHDIVRNIDRVEIGHTWYARSWQGTHINTTCKLLLIGHAFDTLGCKVVGLRTDAFNFRSQRAIEALGAKKDGVIRHFRIRRDGTVRDSVMYSILAGEWPDVRRHLLSKLDRLARNHPSRNAGGRLDRQTDLADLTIRDAVPADTEALLDLYRPFVVDTAVSFELEPPSRAEFAERVATAQSKWAWLVAEHRGVPVGYAYGSPYRTRTAYQWSVETSAYVHRRHHGRGIGTALYRRLLALLADKGYCTAFAAITLPNEASIGLHRSLGFDQVGVFRRAGHKFGRWHDVSWWQRQLRDEVGS